MYCAGCEIDDTAELVVRLNVIGEILEEDDSEFKMMLQERPYNELAHYIRTKFAGVRKCIDRSGDLAILREGGTRKEDSKSDCLRRCGNEVYNNDRNYERAMKFYYKALAFAKTDEKRALCYNNIAVIFLKMEKYKCCLAANEKCRELCTKNDGFLANLSKREKRANELLQKEDKTVFPTRLPLSYPANPTNPEVVSCIQVGANGGVFTTQDLKVGDVIAVTKPFIKGCAEKFAYTMCRNCWNHSAHTDIVPCAKCTYAVYCSNQCKDEDYDFHQIICDRIYWILSDLGPTELMSLNFAYKVLSKGIDIRKNEPKTTPFDWEGSTFENQVKAIRSMRIYECEDIQFVFMMINSYFLLLDQLKKSKAFRNLVAKFENGEELFFKTYWKGFEVMRVGSVTKECTLYKHLPSYFDLISGWFNHSCAPNVCHYRHQNSDVVHYTILEKVKAGNELFVAYEGHSFFNATLKERKMYSNMNLGFHCKCNACLNGWEITPNFSLSPYIKKVFDGIIKKVAEQYVLTNSDVERFSVELSKGSVRERFLGFTYLYKFYFGLKTKDLYPSQ